MQQITPTSTWEPLWTTPTPRPTNIDSCPPNLPLGWGTVTPDISWYNECQECVYQLTPTYSPVLTGTVVPTQTVTPVPTLTPTTGSPYHLHCTDSSGVSGCPGGHDSQSLELERGVFNQEYFGILIYNASEQQVYSDVNVYIDIAGTCPNEGNACLCKVRDSLTGDYVIWESDGYTACHGSYQTNYVNVVTKRYWGWAQNDWQHGSGTMYGAFSLYPFQPTSTPGPTVTPSPTYDPNSICSEVQGEGEMGGGSDDLNLPVFRVGPATCVEIPEFSGDTSGLSWIPGLGGLIEQIDFPGLEICFRPVDFGSLDFLGISIDLNISAMLLAGAVLLRMVVRS